MKITHLHTRINFCCILFFIFHFSFFTLNAQSPNAIPYQAVARNASGNLITNQNVSLRFSIHDVTAGGTIVYRETQSAATNGLGLFSVNIGQGTPVSGSFDSINWGSGAKFTQVEMDPAGGTSYIDMGTQQMMSVPYALYAEHSNDSGPAGPQGLPGPIGPQGPAGVPPVEVQSITGGHAIGESYGGGIVFYVYNNGHSGLIAATSDQGSPSGVRWYGGSNTNTCARAIGVNAGIQNTTIIIANQGPVDGNIFAARICNQYSVTAGGVRYADWYLPSSYELDLLYQQKNVVGGFSNNTYWSSTEGDNISANAQWFLNGSVSLNSKSTLNMVRPIRAFYGNDVGIVTHVLPAVSTTALSSIAIVTATSGGNVSSDGNATVTARGVCWSVTPNPTTADSKTINGTGTGIFSSSLTGLTGGTTYYVRAYATNLVGTAYGSELSFTTLPIALATLSTTAITSITAFTATSGGNITNDGGTPITTRGICWSLSPNPTTANNITSNGTGAGAYSSNITGLTPGSVYYVRAYATNTTGTSYGNELSFTALVLPTLTTLSATSISSNTATSGGDITSDGGTTVTSRGVCWSTSANPTTADSKTIDGTGTGTYISSVTGLTGSVLYYLRAYATNTAGTAYGNQISFTTAAPVLATITTTAASSITGTTALSGGNITDDGGALVTVRGVCWSTSPNPTIALSTKTTNGSGVGNYPSSITGLTPSATWYVRAYATNSVGTAYGNEISFTSNSGIVTLTTTAACASGATGGNITSDGGDPVIARGVCYSTTPNPTTANSVTINGSGTGTYSSMATGLTTSTTYYVRAYATNSVGTYYGNQVSFVSASIVYTIGQSFGGGKIFYIDCSGIHGLIAATSDQSTGVRWDNAALVVTGATAAAVGTGQANTTTIITMQGAGTYAATVCDNLTFGGQTDWYLPSRDELHLLFQSKAAVGGFAEAFYWSSTEDDIYFAWMESFYTNGGGTQGHYNKASATPRVRAIRSF